VLRIEQVHAAFVTSWSKIIACIIARIDSISGKIICATSKRHTSRHPEPSLMALMSMWCISRCSLVDLLLQVDLEYDSGTISPIVDNWVNMGTIDPTDPSKFTGVRMRSPVEYWPKTAFSHH
jgi:hypothetical protein